MDWIEDETMQGGLWEEARQAQSPSICMPVFRASRLAGPGQTQQSARF